MSWYYSEKLKPVGPVSLEAIKEKIAKGEVGPYDLLLVADGEWKPAADYKEFPYHLFPAWQEWDRAFGDTHPEEKKWVLLFKNSQGVPQQAGPVSSIDVQQFIQAKNQDISSLWIWKTGLSGWARVQDRPEFRDFILPYL